MPSRPLAQPGSLTARAVGAVARALVDAVLPQGGQAVARRNAWAGRSAAAARTRSWREADAAVAAATARFAVREVAEPPARLVVGG